MMFSSKKMSSRISRNFHCVTFREKEALKKLPDFPTGMDVKKMAGTRNIYRIRVGDYRILPELEIHTLKVFSVVLRKKL